MDNPMGEGPLKFKKFTIEDVPLLRKYFEGSTLHLSDYSAAFNVMWREYFIQYYAIAEGCLVFAEFFRGRLYFHYPVSLNGQEAEERALDEIEAHCRVNGLHIHYTSVPKDRLCRLIDRYGTDVKITNPRRWRDYLYNAADFVTFPGKKFAGQRNHVNKFKKLYPDYEYTVLTSADEGEITAFLKEYEKRQLSKGTLIAKEELTSVYKLLKLLDYIGLPAGGLRVGGKLVAFSVGEVCGDMLVIHVEKALTEYDGVYCTMANEFAKHNVTENITTINREDDAGDRGLRKSKLQYNPVALGDKFTVIPHRIIDGISRLPEINGGRVEIREITDTEAQDFYRLETDLERNKYWGYDWREDCKGQPTAEYFLSSIREDFAKKEEMPLGIFVDCKLAGEVVLHNFGYRSDCEIGVRLLTEYEGKGYAKEALIAVSDYALFVLDAETVYAKCFKPNERSKRALLAAGMVLFKEDNTYFYFKKTAKM
ncbi:MAG: GNAT family N-acetyltransferase [Clostridia bacterium]|nr:GNAT family N-acetyltransferase [Clostridia bacterium]